MCAYESSPYSGAWRVEISYWLLAQSSIPEELSHDNAVTFSLFVIVLDIHT